MAKTTFAGFGGAHLDAELYGRSDNPGVLLLGLQGASWDAVAAALADAGRYVIRLELRNRDVDAQIGDLRTVLAELGSRPVIVAAAQGGSIAALTLGEGAAQLATGLVLIDPGPADPRLDAAARNLTIPVLAVHGAQATAAFSDAIPDVETVEAIGPAGILAADQADAFSALLLDFLERRVPRQAPEYRTGSDPRTLRDALGCFGTGVTVVTTIEPGGRPIGLTANSFTSVSLDPPLLLVCLANSAASLPAFLAAPHFAVNVLHIGQQPVSGRFAARVEDRFAGTPWERWETGVPIIENSLASFECAREAVHVAGDHHIVIGHVLRVRFEPRRDPLLYFRGKYRRLHFD
ncbi:flavin reductase family protein [Sphingomonas japonica]|uniref:Flavin reductase (DIM6/NTAB) family NADH-FMN oxidoreductase RutF n=1 Tax=Sphingomonas japonica TaxID=511662 RepID=A0ABX0U1X3_9SPHN|nr:flavin reductase family protein [Sphingomonas japonica]NIJ23351.1 flavin reductase (DIM6/NTAB) family NADH-FMN oxidoreductase RutF [Sphingomonas japonica]